MELDSIIEKRHSVRSFKDKKASWKLVLEAIDAANKGPFADGRNPLKFLIIEEEPTINKIAELAGQLWINESSILVLICTDDTNLENLHGKRGKKYSRQQSGAAINTLILKLTDLGLSSCWVGAFTDEQIKQYLKIPSHIELEAIIPIGYEKSKPSLRRRKKALDNSLFWEKWDQGKRPSLFAEEAPEPAFIE
ncbi:MAG: nitroreductase family protein [Nanoarchaeota archaeon]